MAEGQATANYFGIVIKIIWNPGKLEVPEVCMILPVSSAITCFLNIKHNVKILSLGPTVQYQLLVQELESCNIHVSDGLLQNNTINIMSYVNLSRELLFMTYVVAEWKTNYLMLSRYKTSRDNRYQ